MELGKKKSQGRKKILIERIAKTSQRQVTFSKRRAGIFKKGSELCTLCGVDIVIGVFSPAGKPFTFGHPWPEHVLKRYFNDDDTSNAAPLVLSPEEEQHVYMQQLIQQQMEQQHKREKELLDELEMEKKMMKRLRLRNRNKDSGDDEKFWWEEPIEEGLSVEVLEQMRVEMVKVRDEVVRRLHNMRDAKNIVEGIYTHGDSTSSFPSYCSDLVPYGFGF
ncbi:hypothetical protein Scep_028972 [Stephania cephalantha]|uniref:MADS-box domain-containing protein n=1 Tax=Stephania cephalantha TaxID=152367 RepID=A0AAP0EAY3_9MAGN